MSRSRTRRIAKWVGTASCGLLLLFLLLGNWRTFWWIGKTEVLQLGKGGFCAGWWSEDAHAPESIRRQLISSHVQRHSFSTHRWSFDYLISAEDQAMDWLNLPLWIPFVLIAIPTVWLWRRDRRHPPGHCQRCGYDLTGNVTGVCSECAAKVES